MKKAPAVVVMGMHRSGTSMIASCLIRLGVTMGENLLQPDSGNPLGYYEDKEFLEVNKKLIELAGGEWNMPVNRKQLYPILQKYSPMISKLVYARESQHAGRLWGWKDPRNCLTAWMYHVFLRNPRYIIIYRNRQAVLKSLIAREGDAVNWAQLAKHYTEHITAFLRIERPRCLIVHYEDITQSPLRAEVELFRIINFLGSDLGKLPRALEMIRFKEK